MTVVSCLFGSCASIKSRTYRPRALLLSLALLVPDGFALAPTILRTEFLDNPLGLDTTRPRFSWIVEDPSTGARQTASQVQVASALEKLTAGRADLWDSGKVTSAKSHLVEHGGGALLSRQRLWWRVKSWDKDGKEGEWSRPARCEVGLLHAAVWQAEWIAVPQEVPVQSETARTWAMYTGLAGEDHAKTVAFLLQHFPPAPLFRREFAVAGKVRSARLYLGVRGYAVPSLNGRRVGERRLDPAYREYDFNTHYVVLDVAEYLRAGRNVIGLELGGGWHGIGEERAIGAVEKLRKRSESFIARLDIETDHGRFPRRPGWSCGRPNCPSTAPRRRRPTRSTAANLS